MADVKGMQLSRNTVTGNLEDQLKNDIDCCECLSLQVEESTDITDVAQFSISIRLTLNNMSAKEEILTILPLKGHTQGEDVLQAFMELVDEIHLP
ncbi:general transcription factor II-I repeat domain-containing protein 2A-like [Scomber scombrus]|uniref:General transcription factor II-I repeat domain-containing protein 2A-like n=1 Tax=Scomber scombrus TaxID=13677 RepID=A0AAV1Q4L1_SCOSC